MLSSRKRTGNNTPHQMHPKLKSYQPSRHANSLAMQIELSPGSMNLLLFAKPQPTLPPASKKLVAINI